MHPFITGNYEDPIPLTAHELFLAEQTSNRIYGMLKILPVYAYLIKKDQEKKEQEKQPPIKKKFSLQAPSSNLNS